MKLSPIVPRAHDLRFPRSFIHLVIRFAMRMSEVDGIPRDESLLVATPLYPNFKLGRGFDPTHPVWLKFLSGFHKAGDPIDWTYAFYLDHARAYAPRRFGCFDYSFDAERGEAHMHFGNLDTSGMGSLSRARRPARERELRALVDDLLNRHPEVTHVRGGSWLYHLPAYRALFPPEYTAACAPTPPGLTYLSVWGQFLDGRWGVRPRPTERFLANIAAATSRPQLEAAFPLPVLTARAAIQEFRDFYRFT